MRIEISQLEELNQEEQANLQDAVKQDHDILCLLCTIKTFLVQSNSAQVQFDLEGGYDFLFSLLISILPTHEIHQSCSECISISSLISNLETDSGRPLFVSDFQTNLIFFFLSLLFDSFITPNNYRRDTIR